MVIEGVLPISLINNFLGKVRSRDYIVVVSLILRVMTISKMIYILVQKKNYDAYMYITCVVSF